MAEKGKCWVFATFFDIFKKYVSICFEQRKFNSTDILDSYLGEKKWPFGHFELGSMFPSPNLYFIFLPFSFFTSSSLSLSLSPLPAENLWRLSDSSSSFSEGEKGKTGQRRSKKTVREPNQLVRNFSNIFF